MNSCQSLKFINSSDSQIKLVLEPWAEQYKIAAGSRVEIAVDKTLGSDTKTEDYIEFEYDGENIIVYGWADSLAVYCNGEKLEPDFG